MTKEFGILWEASDRPRGKRPKALIPILIEAMQRHGHFGLGSLIRSKLLSISAATIERVLPSTREKIGDQRSI